MEVVIKYLGGSVSNQKENWTRWDPVPTIPGEHRWPFESLDIQWWYKFPETYWWLTPLVIGSYWVSLFLLTIWMRDRPPVTHWGLKVAMLMENGGSALFSILILYRTSDFIFRLADHGPNWFHRSLCYRTEMTSKEMFWLICGGWSKLVQLVDTFFLVLKKRRVPFFHIFHHTAMITLPMTGFPYGEPVLFWFCIVNIVQHVFTYTILLLKTLKFPLPPGTSSFLLLCELVQMTLCVYMGLYTVYVLKTGGVCLRHPSSIAYFNFLYFSLGLLVLKMSVDHFALQSKSKDKLKVI